MFTFFRLNHSTLYITLSLSLSFICTLMDFTPPLSIALYIFIYFYFLLFSLLIVLYTFFNVSVITINFFFLESSNSQASFGRIILILKKILYCLVGSPPALDRRTSCDNSLQHFTIPFPMQLIVFSV